MTLPVLKTPKCYVGGAFIRSESGRVYELRGRKDEFIANIPLCTRKDLRNAVEAAAKGGANWSARSAYNRGQILYRLAEMMESRATELAAAIGTSPAAAGKEVRAAIDRVVHYAGWADKYEQVLGSVNPVPGPYFNFTVTESMGVVAIAAPDEPPLLSLVSLVLPPVVSGNSVVVLASHSRPQPALVLGEILAVSDLPGGVINLLTGLRSDLLPTAASHEYIRVIHGCFSQTELREIGQDAAESVKRIQHHDPSTDWFSSDLDSPYEIARFTEAKTVWHPMGA